ncbi:MAG: hypothetical protein QW607_04555 [Desulfurococcaceae archaeon]
MNIREEDYYECFNEDILTGRINLRNIKCPSLVLIGYTSVKGIVVSDNLVIVGGGFINFLACNRCLIISHSKPFILNRVYCKKAYIIGTRHPVIVKYIKTGEAYLSNTVVDEIESNRLIVNRRVCISSLKKCIEVVFKTPYCWIEELNCKPFQVLFEY